MRAMSREREFSGPRLLLQSVEPYPEVSSITDIPETCQKAFAKVPTVGVAVKVISISDINMAGHCFLADFNINVCWIGDADAGPQVQLYNMVEQMEWEQVPMPVSEEVPNKDPVVKCRGKKGGHDGATDWSHYYRLRVRGMFRQKYDLARFPFDTQHLTVLVRLKSRCKLTPVRWGPNGEASACDSRCISDGFTLMAAEVDHAYLPSYKFGGIDGYDPEARIVFTLARDPYYWIVSYGVVSSLICSLIACTFAIPVEHVDARLSFASTLVLTMTATKFLMMEHLPAASYFTLLDVHIVLCCGVLIGLTVLIGFTGHLGVESMEKLEATCLPVFAAVWIVYHVIIALGVICLSSAHRTRK